MGICGLNGKLPTGANPSGVVGKWCGEKPYVYKPSQIICGSSDPIEVVVSSNDAAEKVSKLPGEF